MEAKKRAVSLSSQKRVNPARNEAGTDTYSFDTFNLQRVDWVRSLNLLLGARPPFGQTSPDLAQLEIALEDHNSNALAL